MEKEFVPYEIALELKKLGFNEPCFGFYIDNEVKYNIISIDKNTNNGWVDELFCTAPTFSQAFRFFREKYPNLYFGIGKIYNGTSNYHFHINLQWEFFEGTYEEAELACIRKLIELAKEQNVNNFCLL